MKNMKDLRCIVCGKPVKKGDMCTGVIKSMKVTVCREHAEQCKNCESRTCGVVK